MDVRQGASANLTREYRDGTGALADATSPRLDIFDADGIKVIDDATPTHVSTGLYSYAYPVAVYAPTGLWRVAWRGTVGSTYREYDEYFNVEPTLESASTGMASPSADAIYVSRYGSKVFGIQSYSGGVLTDADDDVVLVDMTTLDGIVTIFSGREAVHIGEGLYSVEITSADTVTPGQYKLMFRWTVSSVLQQARVDVAVGESAPYYDSLSADIQGVVDDVWLRLADLYDSPYGGPHLQVYLQSRFNRNRIAQLTKVAVGVLNTVAQPYQTYSIDPGGKAFPAAQWGPLLGQAAWIEVLKHLRRSYVEQPVSEGVGTARLDRRDYLQRWGEILNDEKETFADQLEVFKIASMGLGSVRVMVAGGAYGAISNQVPLSLPARPNYWARALV